MREGNVKPTDYKVCVLGLWAAQEAEGKTLVKLADALESGRWVKCVTSFPAEKISQVVFTRSPAVLSPLLRVACRDIGGSDPERMAAPRVADYVQELFKDSPVQVARNPTSCVQTEAHNPLVFSVRRKPTVIS